MCASVVWPIRAEAQVKDPADVIATYMARDRLPSLSVAVARRGAVLYAAAFGLADVENSVPATVNTVYRIGSVSKVITATAVMQLSERRRLDLDVAVQTYCASFPDKGVSITPRLLLAHLGGIRDYNYQRFREEFLSSKRYESVSEALGVFKDDPLAAKPGERHLYSSFGYVLLGCVVEGASGVSFGDYVEKNILEVSGMKQTKLDVPEEIVPYRARTYSKGQDGAWANPPFVDLSDRFPAGGFLSTPRDLVALGTALFQGKLLDQETWIAMIDRQKTRSGEDVDYGLGWRRSDKAGEVFHGGTSVGGSAYLYVRVDTGTVVALATNVDRWTEPRHELARSLADWAESR
jgi:CubicO group peptidase (beta-lactamase class C family)